MTNEIRCKHGKCYDAELSLRQRMKLVFNGNSESDQIGLELLERELPDTE